MENYGTNLSPIFNKNQDLVPWIKEGQYIKMLFCNFSNNADIVGILENCRNNNSMYGCSPIQGTRFKLFLKFYEARISEWNITHVMHTSVTPLY